MRVLLVLKVFGQEWKIQLGQAREGAVELVKLAGTVITVGIDISIVA